MITFFFCHFGYNIVAKHYGGILKSTMQEPASAVVAHKASAQVPRPSGASGSPQSPTINFYSTHKTPTF